MKATFDLSTQEGKIRAFNAQNGSSVSLKNLNDGDVIECEAVFQYADHIDSYGSEQDATITVFFGTDGNTYAGVSDTVAKAGDKLIDLVTSLGLPTFSVKVIKQKSGRGQEFLNIALAM